MTAQRDTPPVVVGYLVRDLFFQVRITEGLRRLGLTGKRVGGAADITGLSGFLVDLSVPVERWRPLIIAAHAAPVPVLAFGSHMDQERWQQAKLAGADRIVANSQMIERLPDLIRRMLGNHPVSSGER